ncbi:hypothetical protein I4U23_029287 [Adineta vaga]|nr:hypothetical protein I4U23_029287 [Adineta vaga]
MFYRICCRLIFILILFKSFCYTFPATSIDDIPPEDLALLLNESHEQSDIKESNDPDSSIEKPIMNEQNEAYYLKILCALYGSCSADDDNKITKPPIEYDEKKHKRLLSRLFYGFPKFGKRAFASAFDGIPKFG